MSADGLRTVIEAARRRTPSELARIARRELAYHGAATSGERQLAHAAKTGAPVLAGPFVGEVGFELLYWIPFLRRALSQHGVEPDQVTVLTRGGAGSWYDGVAGSTVEALDLVSVDEFREGLAGRRARAGDRKLMTIDSFDQLLLQRASTDTSVVMHPQAMYGRLRPIWAGWQSQKRVESVLTYAPLTKPERPAGLPDRYVAVKAYFGDAFPNGEESRETLRDLVKELRRQIPVVLVSAGTPLEDHVEWDEFEVDAVVAPSAARSNLVDQTAAVAHAELLVAPYGGFSYLGAFLGVPTLALQTARIDVNPVHLQTLQTSGVVENYRVADGADSAMPIAVDLLEERA